MWQAHLQQFRETHPAMPLRDCMRAASHTYRSGVPVAATPVHTAVATSFEDAFVEKARELGIKGTRKALNALFAFSTTVPKAVPLSMPTSGYALPLAPANATACKKITESAACSNRDGCTWVKMTSKKTNKTSSFCRTSTKGKPRGTRKESSGKTGYMLYADEVRAEVKAELDHRAELGEKVKPQDVLKAIAARWKEEGQDVRDEWNAKAKTSVTGGPIIEEID